MISSVPFSFGDADVPQLVEDWWAALASADDCLARLRSIYPDRMLLLPETGHEAVKRAMQDVQDGVVSLHRAGRYVLGAEQYQSFILERAEERVRVGSTRGDQDG